MAAQAGVELGQGAGVIHQNSTTVTALSGTLNTPAVA